MVEEKKQRTYSGPAGRAGASGRPSGTSGRPAGASGRTGGAAAGRPGTGARGAGSAATNKTAGNSAGSTAENTNQESVNEAKAEKWKEAGSAFGNAFKDTVKKGAKMATTSTFSKENRQKVKATATKAKGGFQGLLDRIYSDVGESLKRWGRTVGGMCLGASFFFCFVAIGSLLVAGVLLIAADDWSATIALIVAGSALVLSLLCLASVPASWFLYGFGQLLDDVQYMKKDVQHMSKMGVSISAYDTNPEDLPEL